jgi:hypothetical protein
MGWDRDAGPIVATRITGTDPGTRRQTAPMLFLEKGGWVAGALQHCACLLQSSNRNLRLSLWSVLLRFLVLALAVVRACSLSGMGRGAALVVLATVHALCAMSGFQALDLVGPRCEYHDQAEVENCTATREGGTGWRVLARRATRGRSVAGAAPGDGGAWAFGSRSPCTVCHCDGPATHCAELCASFGGAAENNTLTSNGALASWASSSHHQGCPCFPQAHEEGSGGPTVQQGGFIG